MVASPNTGQSTLSTSSKYVSELTGNQEPLTDCANDRWKFQSRITPTTILYALLFVFGILASIIEIAKNNLVLVSDVNQINAEVVTKYIIVAVIIVSSYHLSLIYKAMHKFEHDKCAWHKKTSGWINSRLEYLMRLIMIATLLFAVSKGQPIFYVIEEFSILLTNLGFSYFAKFTAQNSEWTSLILEPHNKHLVFVIGLSFLYFLFTTWWVFMWIYIKKGRQNQLKADRNFELAFLFSIFSDLSGFIFYSMISISIYISSKYTKLDLEDIFLVWTFTGFSSMIYASIVISRAVVARYSGSSVV